MKIRPQTADLFQADGQTDMNLIVAFRNFAPAPKNCGNYAGKILATTVKNESPVRPGACDLCTPHDSDHDHNTLKSLVTVTARSKLFVTLS